MKEIKLRKNPIKSLVRDVAIVAVCLFMMGYFAMAEGNISTKILIVTFMAVIIGGVAAKGLREKPLLKLSENGVTSYTLLKDEVLIPWKNINSVMVTEDEVVNKVMGMKISNTPKKLVILEMGIDGKDFINHLTNEAEGKIKENLENMAGNEEFVFEIDLSEVGNREFILEKIEAIMEEHGLS